LIGTSPIRFFDFTWDPPALFAAGDKVAFKRIDPKEFTRLRAESDAGRHRLAPEETPP
jgi:allophanate hydrolase subunit 1